MDAKHTPGPWAFAKYSKKRFGLGCAGHGAWMFLQTIYEDADAPHMWANARLIAAAPDLLEAAQRVLSHKRGEDDWLILAVDCIALEAAIAKATGVSADGEPPSAKAA